jgi:hypothetical protein
LPTAAHDLGDQGYAPHMSFQVTEVQKALKGADYPMKGDQLAELAQNNGADSELVEALRGVREVEGPNGVMKELKGQLGGEA